MYVYKSMAESRATNAHHESRSPAGPRRLGTATRISASLSRRLSAFFGSTPDQDPKAAKFAVLTPGPGMFVNVRNAPRVVIPPPPRTFRKYCAQSEKTATSPSCKQITQPSGTATLSEQRCAYAHRCSEGFLCSSGARPAKTQNGKVCRSTPWPRRASEMCETVRW